MGNLPHEVMVDILSRVPVKPLGRFRCVCKSWLTLLTHPQFVKMHLNRVTENKNLSLIVQSQGRLYSINCEAFDVAIQLDSPSSILPEARARMSIVGSCNGLLCLSDYENLFYIYNPFTRESMILPYAPTEFPLADYPAWRFSIMGFGYAPATEEYKVLRIVFSGYSQCKVKVHTIGTDSWRSIVNVPPYIGQSISRALVNGAIHWCNFHDGVRVIMSFDLGDEQFREFPWPNWCVGNHKVAILKAFDGYLSVFCCGLNGDVEVWAMKDYGVAESWSKVLSIRDLDIVQNFRSQIVDDPEVVEIKTVEPLHICKNGEIVVQVFGRKLIIYDPANKRSRDLRIHKRSRDLRIHGIPNMFHSVTCVESLTSIASLMAGNWNGGEGREYVE